MIMPWKPAQTSSNLPEHLEIGGLGLYPSHKNRFWKYNVFVSIICILHHKHFLKIGWGNTRAEEVFSMDLKKTGIAQMLCKDTLSAECIKNLDTAIRIWTDGYCKGKADKQTRRLMVDRRFAKNAPEMWCISFFHCASKSFLGNNRSSTMMGR